MIFAEAEDIFVAQLTSLYSVDESKELFSIAIEHASGIKKSGWPSRKREHTTERDELLLMQILEQLRTGKPIQYIIGETEFYGLRFYVNPDVLIPRSETEELVDWINRDASKKSFTAILDIGTGSGCIAITLKHLRPESKVWALDVSSKALETALKNSERNKTQVRFVQADILNSNFSIRGQRFDVIVSNPPYVTNTEKHSMHQNVLDHEPHLALFVKDSDPLIFYERIAEFALTHLEKNGVLYFEINEGLGDKIVEKLGAKGFADIQLRKDMQGKNRMIRAINSWDGTE